MKTIFKKGLYFLSVFVLIGMMASCLGSYDEPETYPLVDAELLAFWLYHTDSLPELKEVAFTIEHNETVGKIYNYDSMAYMTVLPEKVFIGYISGAGIDNVLNITNGDSIWVKNGDSIDISVPQTLKVFALDGIRTKTYIAQLNIHQVNPDSMQYIRIASELPFLQTEDTKTVTFNNSFLTYSRIDDKIQLYSSQDAENWTYESVAGLPGKVDIKGIYSDGKRLFAYSDNGDLYVRYDLSIDEWILVNKPPSINIKSILGYLNAGPKQKEGLSMLIESEGIITFAFTGDFIQWDYDITKPVPNNFPLYGFSTHSYQIMLTERITIFGGISSDGTVLNTAWSTETGQYWAKLTGTSNVFPPIEGANVFYYNRVFWLMNGKEGSEYKDRVYCSKDGGITWFRNWENCDLPEDYNSRYNASLVMDKDNKHFYIIGGKQDAVFPEVWKGFLNKMEFEH